MNRLTEAWNSHEIKIFHICTEGVSNWSVYTCPEDYERANSICAACAYIYKVGIISFCHMTTHSHFIVASRGIEEAVTFVEKFKIRYGIYAKTSHSQNGIFRKVPHNIKEISDLYYLKNCISYTLLNPVAAGITKRPEDYRWSSFSAYFTGNESIDASYRISDLGIRKCRSIMKTKQDLSKSKIRVDRNGNVVLKSFVSYRTVEDIYGSQSEFFKSLALTNSAREEEIYAPKNYKYSDNEILAELTDYARRKYGKNTITDLTKEEKHWLIVQARRKMGTPTKKLARLLRVSELEVISFLGIIDNE